MTSKEAVRLKAQQSSTFEEGKIIYKVFVTPQKIDDLTSYLRDIRGFYSILTDDVAKQYSKNGQFVLHGLCYLKKGLNILHRLL